MIVHASACAVGDVIVRLATNTEQDKCATGGVNPAAPGGLARCERHPVDRAAIGLEVATT